MVLQKAPQAATVWGYGEEVGSDVVVTRSDHEAVITTVTEQNTWSVKLPPIKETNSTYTITAKSQNKSIMLKNVLFGDIWICSGQSNMVFTLDMVRNTLVLNLHLYVHRSELLVLFFLFTNIHIV